MEVQTRFQIGDTVFWITQLADSCTECGHFLQTTTPTVWEGEVVGVTVHKRPNRAPMSMEPIAAASVDEGSEFPEPAWTEFETQIEYVVNPTGPQEGRAVIFTEDFFFNAREVAQATLDAAQEQHDTQDQADGFAG